MSRFARKKKSTRKERIQNFFSLKLVWKKKASAARCFVKRRFFERVPSGVVALLSKKERQALQRCELFFIAKRNSLFFPFKRKKKKSYSPMPCFCPVLNMVKYALTWSKSLSRLFWIFSSTFSRISRFYLNHFRSMQSLLLICTLNFQKIFNKLVYAYQWL